MAETKKSPAKEHIRRQYDHVFEQAKKKSTKQLLAEAESAAAMEAEDEANQPQLTEKDLKEIEDRKRQRRQNYLTAEDFK
ncbi:MAG: hypothetical protein WKF30_02370 [Pyrinomonadaceae bacterium]